MGAIWMCAKAQLRARRRAILALGVLLGVMSGAATAAAVGARRTETAYPRFLERYSPFDVGLSVSGDPNPERIFDTIESFPMVRSATRQWLYVGSVRTSRGRELSFPDVFFFTEPESNRGQPGYKVVAGRDLRPDREDEALVNYAMAERLGVRAGDRVTLTLTSILEDDPPPPSPPIVIRVAGVIAYVGGFESSTGGAVSTVFLMSPAFDQRWTRYRNFDANLNVTLHGGEAAADEFERELRRRRIETDGRPTRVSSFTADVQDLNRVPAIALWLLCGFLALTSLAVFTQLIARESHLADRDAQALRSLGFSVRSLLTLGMIRAGAVALVGAGTGVGIAILLSPLTPLGLARIAEPNPGFAFAPGLLALGAAVTLVLILVASAGPAWRVARNAAGSATSSVRGQSPIVTALARAGAPTSMRSGVGLAVEPGRGERAVPIRSTALGLTIALAALAAALTFAFSLRTLIATPRLQGYAWDAGTIANGFLPEEPAAIVARLRDSISRAVPGARTWRGTVFSGAAVDRLEIGSYVSDGPGPSVIDGRAPRAEHEVAVDPRTLDQLGKDIGDRVRVADIRDVGKLGPPSTMTIVGTIAVPRIAFQSPESPGQGVAFTPEGAARLEAPPFDTAFVRFPPSWDFDKGLETLRRAAGNDAFALVSRAQSGTVGSIARLSQLPLVLAGIIAMLGAATLAHALTTTVRRRRHDLAILKTLGFVRRQVRSTVAWQCTALIVAALTIGVPTGIAAGRWGWRLFAKQLQVVPLPTGALAAAIGIPVGMLLLGNLIAAVPAGTAARTPAAVVLRAQ